MVLIQLILPLVYCNVKPLNLYLTLGSNKLEPDPDVITSTWCFILSLLIIVVDLDI
jgi:hypothetical protein